jgi:hypothetical protein
MTESSMLTILTTLAFSRTKSIRKFESLSIRTSNINFGTLTYGFEHHRNTCEGCTVLILNSSQALLRSAGALA